VQFQGAASALYQDTVNVYAFQVKCAKSSQIAWHSCGARTPDIAALTAATGTFDAEMSNVSDRTVKQFANQFANAAVGAVSAPTTADGENMRSEIIAAWVQLNGHLGELIQGR
jgi:hypothetical protein